MELVVAGVLSLIIYIFLVGATIRGFKDAKGTFPTLFWTVLFLLTLSFLFSGNKSNQGGTTSSSGGGDLDDDGDLDNDNNRWYFDNNCDFDYPDSHNCDNDSWNGD